MESVGTTFGGRKPNGGHTAIVNPAVASAERDPNSFPHVDGDDPGVPGM